MSSTIQPITVTRRRNYIDVHKQKHNKIIKLMQYEAVRLIAKTFDAGLEKT